MFVPILGAGREPKSHSQAEGSPAQTASTLLVCVIPEEEPAVEEDR